MIDALIMPVYVMLDNSLFDRHKHPLETRSSRSNEHTNMDIASSFSCNPRYSTENEHD